jgi:predicted dehydrogenase
LSRRVRIAVIGCGAVVERLHGPALAELAAAGEADIVALCDPDATRLAAVAATFPRAATFSSIDSAIAARPDLGIIASPAGLHAEQCIALVDAGIHVLCEKPIAARRADAERMVAAASRARRVLAVGLLRRFFPSARLVRDLVGSGRLGELESATVLESGGFHWPFRSAAAFVPHLTPGGILLDVGVHVLDLLAWWFPQTRVIAYEDDAMGGSEATSIATLRAGGAPLTVKLTRDWPIAGRYDLRFAHGRIGWDGVDPVNVRLEYHGPGADVRLAAAAIPAQSWGDCFRAQLQNVIDAVRDETAPAVSGADAIPSLSLIDECYQVRTLLKSPWFSEAEADAASRTAAEKVSC